ncbi:MAG: hypothetical protein OXU64_04770 [Gemmatimonadota bacterium]|nr:hypothetical protein [Gemmatimonadota bacterium]
MSPVGVALAVLALAGGTARAQDTVELPLEDRVLTAGFPEVYRIGDGVRDWELLTRVTSVGFDARGNLHIGDWSDGDLSVLVVDPRGELVVRFGRPGEGPGDFRNATHASPCPTAAPWSPTTVTWPISCSMPGEPSNAGYAIRESPRTRRRPCTSSEARIRGFGRWTGGTAASSPG